jgi:FlaA1/EpsC-like NDP-sugar epimerase
MRKLEYDPYSGLNQQLIDSLIAGISFSVAYLARFDGHLPPESRYQMWYLLPAVMLGQAFFNLWLGTYRMVWRYVGLADAVTLTRNFAALPAVLLALRYATPAKLAWMQVPLGVILLAGLLSLLGSLTARAVRRLLDEGLTSRTLNGAAAKPVLLVGAGRAGTIVAKEIRTRTDIRPVGFLDDDPKKLRTIICGLRVLGPVEGLAAAIQRHGVRQVMVCVAPLPLGTLKRIWATCEELSIPVKLIPSLEEILQGKATIANFRNVEMKDLLGRNPVELPAQDQELLETYSGKSILVTGAGGSIGSELAYQLTRLNPRRLILLDKDENGLNDTYLRLLELARGDLARGEIVPVVADVRFSERVRSVFASHCPDVVFHAAAHKHVHLMEVNPCEAIANNVVGTRHLVEHSLAFGVGRFIQISTDKAVNPASVMGASKRVCEMIVQAQRNRKPTRFCCVRFGNVLGSRGSVVPIFQKQILQGGPVTLTHPDAQRFLMTIPEAVCLLIQAGTLADVREIFTLDMGEPVLIQNLARDLIQLSGLCPGRDIPIQVTHMHRGEKLTEALVDESTETVEKTRFEKVQKISSQPFDVEAFFVKLKSLERAALRGSQDQVYDLLTELNMGFDRQQKDHQQEDRRQDDRQQDHADGLIGTISTNDTASTTSEPSETPLQASAQAAGAD